jgi:hypothetical protein
MIDLVLIQQRWISAVINCRTFQSADISSDHSLVLCNIKLRLKKMDSKTTDNYRIDMRQLNNEKIRLSYITALAKNIESIQLTCGLEEHATKIKEAIKSAVETTVPAKKISRKPWISKQTLKLADEKRRLKQIQHTSTQHAEQYKEMCKKVKKSARHDKENWIDEQCEEVEKGLKIGNTRQAYSLIKMLGKKFIPRLNVIRNKEGTILQSKEEVKHRWT